VHPRNHLDQSLPRLTSAARRTIPEGAVESTWRTRDGQEVRRIDWPVVPGARGSLLFMPGRGDYYEKWLESLEYWAAEGWAVSASDWRGQALSGRMGFDATTGHTNDFAGWVEDLATLWAQWVVDRPGPHVLVAHSMGGHIALRAVAEKSVQPDALVITAPMLGIHPVYIPARILHPVARLMAAMGDRRRPAWKLSEKPELIPRSRQLLLTHDDSRYDDEAWWRRARPGLGMGSASWGWIESALASIRSLEAPGLLERVEVPVLIVATRHDGLVSWPATRRAAARLPKGELVVFGKECRHEILREVDEVRDRALGAIDAFLDRVAPVANQEAEFADG